MVRTIAWVLNISQYTLLLLLPGISGTIYIGPSAGGHAVAVSMLCWRSVKNIIFPWIQVADGHRVVNCERVLRLRVGAPTTVRCCSPQMRSRSSTWSCSTRAACLCPRTSVPLAGLSQQHRSSTWHLSIDSSMICRLCGQCVHSGLSLFVEIWIRSDIQRRSWKNNGEN